jgi:hypothetical protein
MAVAIQKVETAASSAAQSNEKKARHRSPNYPAESLEAALKRTRKLYDADHEAGSTVQSAALHMGFKKAHGEAMSVLAGLKKFGLVEMKGDRAIVTKRAVNILLFPNQDRGTKSLQEAVLLPHIYRELFNRFRGTGLPSDQTLRAELIADYGFNPNSVDAFLKDFRASLKFAGISPETVLSSPEQKIEEPHLEASEDETLKPEDQDIDRQQQPPPFAAAPKSKVFNVALDPLASDNPQFAQVLIPVPLRDEQKKRLRDFIESL